MPYQLADKTTGASQFGELSLAQYPSVAIGESRQPASIKSIPAPASSSSVSCAAGLARVAKVGGTLTFSLDASSAVCSEGFLVTSTLLVPPWPAGRGRGRAVLFAHN